MADNMLTKEQAERAAGLCGYHPVKGKPNQFMWVPGHMATTEEWWADEKGEWAFLKPDCVENWFRRF